jgi:hypothetical protein
LQQVEGHAVAVTKIAAVPGPFAGVRVQAVIHVQRANRVTVRVSLKRRQRVQQNGGIETAAEGDATTADLIRQVSQKIINYINNQL